MVTNRFNHIRHGDNSGLLTNLIALEAVRVAGTVQTLMVLQNNIKNRPWKLYILENLIALLRVGFNQLELNIGQFSRRIQNLSRNMDFTDVVNTGTKANGGHLFLTQPHLGRNRHR